MINIKMKEVLLVGVSLITLSGCYNRKLETYEEFTDTFVSIEAQEISNKEDQFILYTGRETCPYCQVFVPKLYEAPRNIKNDIYYLDIEDSDLEIISILEKYNIQYVPDLTIIDNDSVVNKLEIDSEEITSQEILHFINQ